MQPTAVSVKTEDVHRLYVAPKTKTEFYKYNYRYNWRHQQRNIHEHRRLDMYNHSVKVVNWKTQSQQQKMFLRI